MAPTMPKTARMRRQSKVGRVGEVAYALTCTVLLRILIDFLTA